MSELGMRVALGPPGLRADSGGRVRQAWFEDVPDVLRLIRRAIEHGCRQHYSAGQRQAVFLGYAQSLFLEVTLPFETVVSESEGQIVAAAQLDPTDGRLRALFVDGDGQGRGHGRDLLAWAVGRARVRGLHRLHGAMSLNAVPFYARAGFHPCPGNRWIAHGRELLPVVPMERFLDADPGHAPVSDQGLR